MIALQGSAFAWDCQPYFWLDNPNEDHDKRSWCPTSTCRHPPGSSVTYFFRSGDFTSAQRTALADGDHAWTAGPGTALPDATFAFVPSSTLVSTRSFDDTVSTVSDSSATWFNQSTGVGGALAVSITTISGWPSCNWRATDIVFNESFTWTNALPSDTPEGTPAQFSLGGVMQHELGHSFGLVHNDSPVRLHIMNAFYPGAADTSAKYRAQEDEARALVAIKGNGSSNRNFMLSRFITTGTSGGNVLAEDEWRNGASNTTYGVSIGTALNTILSTELLGDTFTGTLNASITGNVTSFSPVTIEWAWRPTNATWSCQNPPQSAVMTSRSVGLINNSPSQLSPPVTLTVPSNSVVGQTYRVCAVIDPGNTISETRTNDNVIFTEHAYQVTP